MIEFKSPCGHTVRARDEDAGRDVKCSYCGKEVRVPSDRAEDLDFLLAEATDATTPSAARPSARRAGPFLGRRRRGDNRPLDVVLKLTYAAVAVTVVGVVLKVYILPALEGGEEPLPPPPSADSGPARPPRDAYGLGLEGPGGLYVSAVPASAEIYVVPESKACSPGRRIAGLDGCRKVASGESVTEADGAYMVEVVLAWNDKSLKAYPDYNTDFRHRLEALAGKDEERNALMRAYFMPDGADSVFVAQTTDQMYLVRQYKVRPRKDAWEAVQALFIPARTSVEDIVARYLPTEDRFRFDEEHVRSELEYYNVPLRDRTFVLDALRRIGVMTYQTEEGAAATSRRTRLFRIDVSTGQFRTQILKDPAESTQANAGPGK